MKEKLFFWDIFFNIKFQVSIVIKCAILIIYFKNNIIYFVTKDEGTSQIIQFSISYPTNGTTKSFEIDDDNRCRVFFEKRMGQEVEADTLG